MAHGGALVDHLNAVSTEFGDVLAGVVAGGFDDGDSRLDDGCAIFGIGHRLLRRQQGQVDPERPIGQLAAAGNLRSQCLRARLGQRRQRRQATGVGHRRNHLGTADPLHAALHDRVFDAEGLGETGPEHAHGLPPRSDRVPGEHVRAARQVHEAAAQRRHAVLGDALRVQPCSLCTPRSGRLWLIRKSSW